MDQLNGSASHVPLVLDPKKPLPFKPRDNGPTYLLRVPRVADRAAYRHAVAAAGGRRWKWFELLAAAEAAVKRMLPGEENAEERVDRLQDLAAWADEVRAAILAYQEDRSETNLDELVRKLEPSGRAGEVFSVLTMLNEDTGKAVDPVLASRMADNIVYMERAGLVAVRMFLRGWDIEDVPFKRTPFGIDEGQLDRVPTDDLTAIAQRIESLMEPQEERMGNSSSASSSSSSPESSTTTKTPVRKNRSKETGGMSTSSTGATED